MTSQPRPENGQLTTQPTIGVFDSGFGGLTVLRALLPLVPEASYIYLGDTARLPYGSKSHDTIARYAVSSAKFLHEQGAELLVVACNTATALALEDIQQSLPIPVIGVVQPGAQAALAVSRTGTNKNKGVIPSEAQRAESRDPRISLEPSSELSFQPERSAVEKPASLPQNQPQVLVLATQATVQSQAYTRALAALNLEAHEKACPLLVPLVEEGWINHPVTDEVLKIYLTEALAEAPNAQTLLLGCTHYPLLEPAIHRVLATLNHPLTVIDSAKATAEAVAAHLTANPSKLKTQNSKPTPAFYATDSIEKFERLGSAFLGQPVTGVRHVDLGG